MRTPFIAFLTGIVTVRADAPWVNDSSCAVNYKGIERNGTEIFMGIPYAQDTSGENRFKPPRPYFPAPGSIMDATSPGAACPQPLGQLFPPLALGNITYISEDCLNLNIARPKSTNPSKKLPVMVWIHGGSFWWASNTEPTTAPDGIVLQSVKNGSPIIHVAMNYRLGVFGFAQSEALKSEGSENAGLRDQRVAIELNVAHKLTFCLLVGVRDNIEKFGGDPNKITIFGQSSGGLAVGMQILAYGGTKPIPFQQGIAQSQALEPGITGNFTKDAMIAAAAYVGCNTTCVDAPETIACLRQMDMDKLLDAAVTTYASDIGHNIGDIWLPVVDGDFLPAKPSQLIAEGRIGKATFISGWTQDDLNYYTDPTIKSADDTYNFMRAYLPAMPKDSLNEMLDMYPVDDFSQGRDLSSEFYRTARIFRDILMVCPSIHLGAAVNSTHSAPVYLYNFNSTILDTILAITANISGLGVVHTSEFAFIFASLQSYNISGFPFGPTEADYELTMRASRSWSTFASQGAPSSTILNRLQDWDKAFGYDGGPYVMTIGGPHAGISALGGTNATRLMQEQKLDKRCAFLNSPSIIHALQY